MRKPVGNLIIAVFIGNFLYAQCPDQKQIWDRISYLRQSATIAPKEKLAELQGYLSKITSCPYRNDSTHASLLGLLGGVYGLLNDFTNAVSFRQQAIDLVTLNAGKPSVKSETLPGLYYWLAVAYDSLNNFPEKMRALDSCSSIAMRLNYVDRAVLTAVYTHLQYFFDIGDYRRCIDYALRCQVLARQYGNNNTSAEQKVAESYVSSAFGWQVLALIKLKEFAQAETLLVNKVEEYKKQKLTNYLGTTYSQLAELQQSKGDYKNAIANYRNALAWDTKAGYTFNCKQTLKDLGYTIYISSHEETKALSFYKTALGLKNSNAYFITADAFESLDIYSKIATAYANRRLYDSAFFYFQAAFDQIKKGSDEKSVLASTNEIIGYKKIHYLTRLLLEKGVTLLDQYKNSKNTRSLHRAIAVFKNTDALLDRIRQEQKDPQSKLFWRADSRRLYENAIEACYLSADYDNALYFFEKSKAVLLADQLNEQRWLGQKDIQQQTLLKKKILELERIIFASDKSSKEYEQLQTGLFAAKQSLDRIQQNLKKKAPLYYQNFVRTESIHITDVQKKILKDHSALIQFFEGDSAVYVFFLFTREVRLKKIEKALFDKLSKSYIEFIASAERQNKNFAGFVQTSAAMYHLIFQNIPLPEGRIIFSPDGTHFPFEALVTGTAPLIYFLEKHVVSYTYSARYLLNEFSSAKGSLFLGVAPVQYAGFLHLPSLQGSDGSLQRLKKDFSNSTVFLTNEATRRNFLHQFYRHNIVQLYTHATDSGYNGEPTIYFRDSALLLSDLVYEAQPATRLIVLSACETANGKTYQGEGVFSFNRGFASIGIPSSITTLWQVDNESTYRLTELFYKWLAKGEPLDLALQKAKIQFLQEASGEKKLPYFWAAPVLAGQSGAIEVSKKIPLLWLVAIVMLMALSGWFLTRRIKARRSRKMLGQNRWQ